MSASNVVPAHLSYLAIYNPTLGPTDETVRDQLVFYYSHETEEELGLQTKGRSTRAAESRSPSLSTARKDVDESTDNDRLRQVGLAQGMVNFVKNFSSGIPLESIETEKSRLVLKEVEPDWWILASINLTQLPTAARSSSTSLNSAKGGRNTPSGDTTQPRNIEYSSREVAPAPLLLSQLVRAHRVFLLHHASSLSDLWKKHEAQKGIFSSLIHRYWTRFIRDWDVLLHGNPAAEIYDAIKLAGGGELGVGVGEEGWGSGEREVLEDFLGRTDGLIDLIIGRYGDPPPQSGWDSPKKTSPPWLGGGDNATAEDGIIFSGVGAISKASLTTLSHWMEEIYMHGDAAYGVGENPTSLSRPHRKKRRIAQQSSQGLPSTRMQRTSQGVPPRIQSPNAKSGDLRRRAMENHATPPGIPAPLVTAVERSLDEALSKADAKAASSDQLERHQTASETRQKASQQESGFNTDKMMKYLSLGYGSSWTLNPRGFTADTDARDEDDRIKEDGTDNTIPKESPAAAPLEQLDPTPDISDDEATPFIQRLEESIGKFLIGLSGDLENTEFEDESTEERNPDGVSNSAGPALEKTKRIFLRTLIVEVSSTEFSPTTIARSLSSPPNEGAGENEVAHGETRAPRSGDSAQTIMTREKVQVAVYVHQPFVFVFLFRLHTSSLSVPGFYRAIHHTLGPLQGSLLRSTDRERWRERMMEALGVNLDGQLVDGSDPASVRGAKDVSETYDLIYDPAKATLRLSIPNIPLPGSLAAEGLHRTDRSVRPTTVSGSWYTLGIPIGSSSPGGSKSSSGVPGLRKSDWTRIEALGVHTHILNGWAATRDKQTGTGPARSDDGEVERTIKTSRNWWIVWMNLQGVEGRKGTRSANPGTEAVLVRRSLQEQSPSSRGTSQSRSDSRSVGSAGKWLLRDQPRSREASGGSSSVKGDGSSGSAGVSEGVGVDTRKWVEAALRLTL